MQAYKCAYRDTKSPLTPIVPLGESSFHFNDDNILKTNTPHFAKNVGTHQQTPRNHLIEKSQKQTPYPHHIIKTPKFVTPQCHLTVNANTPCSDKTPKNLTKQHLLLVQKYQNSSKSNRQCSEKIKTPNYLTAQNQSVDEYDNNKTPTVQHQLKKISNNDDITPKSRFSEKRQTIIQQNQSGDNYKIIYSKKKVVHLQIDGKQVLYEKENIESKIISTKNKGCYCFKNASPIQPKPLSPRVNKILRDNGLSNYKKLFEKEEIDFQVLLMLTSNDLERIGIHKEDDLNKITDTINFWNNDK